MNFLAHYHLTVSTDEDDFKIGSLLPDIARRAEIPLHQAKIRQITDPLCKGLVHGMELHWEADRQFHQAPLFDLGVGLWKVHLGKKLPGVERKYFLFHMAFEMWLDRILIRRKPGSALDMYDDLTLASREGLTHLSSTHLQDRSQALRKTFELFISRRFILDYSDPASFARIATDVFGRVTQQVWQEAWVQPIVDTLVELERFEDDVLFIWDQFSKGFHRR